MRTSFRREVWNSPTQDFRSEGEALDISFGYEPENIPDKLYHLQRKVEKYREKLRSLQQLPEHWIKPSGHDNAGEALVISGKTPKRAPIPDWSKLKMDTTLQKKYSVEVKKRFDSDREISMQF